MKRVYRPSVEDLDAMPEDEWVEVVGGMQFRWAKEAIHLEGKTLVVPLPAKVRKAFRPRKGEVLRARMSKGALIVERPSGRRPRPSTRP